LVVQTEVSVFGVGAADDELLQYSYSDPRD
jgi:hypothetical protein